FTFRAQPQPGWSGVTNCEVKVVEPLRRLVYAWGDGSETDSGLKTVVTWTLTPEAGGTRVRMEQSGFRPADGAPYRGARGGWRRDWSGSPEGSLRRDARRGRHAAAIYSAAARCTRHCASRARSAAGFTVLLSTWMLRARASSRTCGLRSAVIRMAGRSGPNRHRSWTMASMPVPSSRW